MNKMTLNLVHAALALLAAAFIHISKAATSLGFAQDIVVNSATDFCAFPLVTKDALAPIWYDQADWPGVIRAIGDLQADIERVCTRKPEASGIRTAGEKVVIIGTVGRSATIDALIATGKLDAGDLSGKWESFVITTISAPLPGVEHALVIAGSDKRGTIYGIYELSEQIGVSPWYWWADVPTQHQDEVYIKPGRYSSGEPVVRYRGIFLNDEAPCLSGWTDEKFGDMNSQFYTKVFELMLRIRANYLWPAMWDNAFNEDDPENPRLADMYGIVMGTSHHEPMMRAHKEWTSRREHYGNGQWNYATNAEALQRFFREGMARNKDYENLVTIGMRGDGDVGMDSAGSIDDDIKLLERIMSDQRRIIAEEVGVDPATVPQLWALFTEVQKFYEHGLRPPEDVTLLWTDDNNGSIRRLPTAEERQRSGGAGIYYHIDMHGGPFAYQWINTNPLPKIAEQFHLAAEYDATRIWIVNVGDLKPLEIPLEFIIRMAWNPAAISKDNVGEYTRRWAEREFGLEHAAEIADIVAKYGKYNGWRKPDLTTPDTYSQLNYREADRVEAVWLELQERAEALYLKLPMEKRAAYYQLVLHPAKASSIVVRMNIAAGRNQLYAKQGRASTNSVAGLVRALFREDQTLSDYYNHTLSNGKWNHLMDQPHIGMHSWEPPVVNNLPLISEVLPADNDSYGVSIEGDPSTWPDHYGDAVLPLFDSLNPGRSFVDVFALGTQPISFSITANEPWIKLVLDTAPSADKRYWVDVDWDLLPAGISKGVISIKGKRGNQSVHVHALKAREDQVGEARGRFASLSGPIAFDARSTMRRTEVNAIRWEEIPDYGRVEAAMGIYPVTAESILPPAGAPTLEYDVYLPRAGKHTVTLVLGPVMDFVPDRGMRIAIAFDDDPRQILDIFENREEETFLGRNWWNGYTKDNARILKGTLNVASAGAHTLKVSMVDPGIVVQKIIISDKAFPKSYFGPVSIRHASEK